MEELGEEPKTENLLRSTNQKVIVTGGAGFIGSAVVWRLRRNHRIMRFAGFLCASLISLFLFSVEASACTCGDVTVAESRKDATIVFSGKIVKKVKSNAVEKDGVEVTFQVDRVWKGKVGSSVTIYSGATSNLYDFMDLCSPDFELDDRYVVFARGEKLFSNMMCNHTTKLEDGVYGKAVLDQLGRGKRPTREN